MVCRFGLPLFLRRSIGWSLLVVATYVAASGANLDHPAAQSPGPAYRLVVPQLAADAGLATFEWFPARTEAETQSDRCGAFTVVRQLQANRPFTDLFGGPDDVFVYGPDGSLALSVDGRSRAGTFGSLFVQWCFDLERDGNPELAVSDWTGGTGSARLTIYTLAAPVVQRWQFESERTLGTMPVNEDGTLPYELVGADGRFQLLATSRPFGPVPPFVVRLSPAGGATVASDYRWTFESYRNEELERLAQCPAGDLEQQCQAGATLGIMVASLTIGDWDEVRLSAALPPGPRDRVEQCRDVVAAAVANIDAPLAGGFMGCFSLNAAAGPPLVPLPAATATATTAPARGAPTARP